MDARSLAPRILRKNVVMRSCKTLVSENVPLDNSGELLVGHMRHLMKHLGTISLALHIFCMAIFSVINNKCMLVTNPFVLKGNSTGCHVTILLECDPLNLNVKAEIELMRQG